MTKEQYFIKHGKTALMMAAESGHTEDVNVQDNYVGEPALTWAAGIGNTEVVKALLKMVLM